MFCTDTPLWGYNGAAIDSNTKWFQCWSCNFRLGHQIICTYKWGELIFKNFLNIYQFFAVTPVAEQGFLAAKKRSSYWWPAAKHLRGQHFFFLFKPGLHKLWYPVLQLRCALILRELNQIFIACLFKGSQKQSFFLQTLLFTVFLVTVLKILSYALVSTWSSVSSGWEHVKRKMHPWQWCTINVALGRCLVSQTCSILVFSPPIMIRNW